MPLKPDSIIPRTLVNISASEIEKGVVVIFVNAELGHISMSRLRNVTGFTRFESNNPGIKSFISSGPLPFDEPGCRSRRNEVPYITASGGDPTFVTNLSKRYCIVKRVVPILVGTGIMLPMVFVSLLLFSNALIR